MSSWLTRRAKYGPRAHTESWKPTFYSSVLECMPLITQTQWFNNDTSTLQGCAYNAVYDSGGIDYARLPQCMRVVYDERVGKMRTMPTPSPDELTPRGSFVRRIDVLLSEGPWSRYRSCCFELMDRLAAYCVAAMQLVPTPTRFDSKLWTLVIHGDDRFDPKVTMIHEHGACDDLNCPWWRYGDHAHDVFQDRPILYNRADYVDWPLVDADSDNNYIYNDEDEGTHRRRLYVEYRLRQNIRYDNE